MNNHLMEFVNHETNMMSCVQRRDRGDYIVHLADLDSDMRVPPSRIFKDIDAAETYAKQLVNT
jgi:hypothetical protein